MNEQKAKRIKAGVVIGILLVMTVALSSVTIRNAVDPETGKAKMVIDMGNAVAEYSPGAGAIESGWLEIYVYPHDGDPGTTYAENTSATLEAASLQYADTDAFSKDLASETSFDIVARGRWNKTHAWATDKFMDDRCRIKITVTCDNWAVGSNIGDIEGTLVITRNNTADDFIWCNVYWNNAAAGYQIADDATLTVSEISIEGKY